MEIAVLVKPVPEPETRLRPDAGGKALDPDGVKFVLSGYDESAVEQALLLKEAVAGSTVRAFSFGPAPRTEEVLRSALALGADGATWVESDPGGGRDPLLSARALAVALGPRAFDLILLGKQSSDSESGIVPSALGELLGRPAIGPVVDLRWDAGRSAFTFGRAVEGGIESGSARPPIVVALQQAWNDPRSAKLPMILKSRRAPIERIGWPTLRDGLGERASPRSTPTQFRLPPPRSGASMIPTDDPERAARELVRRLREEAKVFP